MESNSVERDEGEWERIRRNPVSAEKSLFESLLGISSTAGLSWLDRSHGRGTLSAIIASLRRMNSSKRSGMCCYSCCCCWTTNRRQRHSDGQTAENPFQIHYINRSCSRHRSGGGGWLWRWTHTQNHSLVDKRNYKCSFLGRARPALIISRIYS